MLMDEENADDSPQADAEKLLPLVYDQLRSLARRRLADERAGHTLQATALVHEAFLRVANGQRQFSSRGHFFAAAAAAMRRILVEHARGRKRLKRGGPTARREVVNVLDLAVESDGEEILAFEEAIGRLEQDVPLAAAVVRLRFYAGLTVDETAEALGVSARTVDREWAYARARLFRLLGGVPET
jgi:RNA polymerase sigma factor (TIGR02999 family)